MRYMTTEKFQQTGSSRSSYSFAHDSKANALLDAFSASNRLVVLTFLISLTNRTICMGCDCFRYPKLSIASLASRRRRVQ